jgi:hypothetical protein
MDELVQRLLEGDHSVVVRRAESAQGLKQSIDRGYVLVTFTDTRGGTELGVSLDEELGDLSGANFEEMSGVVHLVGNLELNGVKVCCVADIDLAVLEGKGYLEILEAE